MHCSSEAWSRCSRVSRQSATAYIDIFDVLNADMRSAGLTQDRAVTSIRTTRSIKETIEGGLDQFEDYAQRAAELSADLIVYLHGRSTVHESRSHRSRRSLRGHS